MKKRIKKIGVFQTAKVFGVLYLILGFLFALPMSYMLSFMSRMTDMPVNFDFGLATIIIVPIIYGILGFVTTAIVCFIYNLLAAMTGGIELELEEAS